LFQLQFYGWLYEQVFGSSPIRLEALNGQGDIVPISPNHQAVLAELRTLIHLKRLSQEPYEPVGWSKCVGCGFRDHCWAKAETAKDVALVYDIDQSLATELHERGAASIQQLMDHFDADSLSELKRPWGEKVPKSRQKSRYDFAAGARDVVGTGGCSSSANHPAS
jgi:predicted RecB family nuclease